MGIIEYRNSKYRTSRESVLDRLPKLDNTEKKIIEELPKTYKIDVPFITQEQKHWSGAAAIQMLSTFHGIKPDTQEQIVRDAQWTDWEAFHHGTFSEQLARYVVQKGFLFTDYYPARYIANYEVDGIEATDFIRTNLDYITDIDFQFFKALLVASATPLLIRLHITTQLYPMPEPQASKIDISGHCVLIVGYDESGFIVHDPWNKDQWGGKAGGPSTHIEYEYFSMMRPPCNGCCDLAIIVNKLNAFFLALDESVYTGKEFTLFLKCEWPGISGLLDNVYSLSNLKAVLEVGGSLTSVSSATQEVNGQIHGGQDVTFAWRIKAGNQEASSPVDAEISGSIRIPVFPWENESKEVVGRIRAAAHTRVWAYDKDFLIQYGKQP